MTLPSRFLLRAFAAAAILLSSAAASWAGPAELRAAIDRTDIGALRREAAASDSEAERKLAAAIELSWRHRDQEALVALTSAIEAQTDPALQSAALWQLFDLQIRLGKFAAAAEAGSRAAGLETPDAAAKQALEFVKPLAGVAPTRASGVAQGRVEVKRDLAGLMRADITSGGVTIGAVLDTGANFSTINESVARRMGLRMLDGAVSVGSSVKAEVPSRIGVADRLSIGGAEFSNVVFIVLPDADLSFAGGAYTIDAILGMPVFFEMGRIAFSREADKEWFSFGRAGALSPGEASGEANILLNGLSPMLLAKAGVGAVAGDVVLLLDTGAQKTAFDGRFAAEFAPLFDGAEVKASTAGGAGGSVVRTDTRKLAAIDLSLAGRTVPLKDVIVEANDREGRHGLLGLDALQGAFAIDFDAGRLELKD